MKSGENKRKKVLVIDDQEAIRKSFELALRRTPYLVETADSGMAGLDKFRQEKHDLIYLDLKMPGMSGVETLRALREIDFQILRADRNNILGKSRTSEKSKFNTEDIMSNFRRER